MMNPPSTSPVWIHTYDGLRRMVADLQRHPRLAVDTESNSLFAYQEQVCLIQFSTGERDYLVDPLALDDLSSLGPLFASAEIEKIFHAAEYDILCLKRDFGFTFCNLFDTMLAARILGRPAVGLGPILEGEFGLQLDKRYQRANWGQRPLTQPQLEYARLDTYYLPALRDRLYTDLEASGRLELAQEDFARLCEITPSVNENGADLCWRVAAGHDLSAQQLAILQELCRYRDQQARHANLPPFKVMGNQVLQDIVVNNVESLEELAQITGMTARQLDRHGAGILAAVQRGAQNQPTARPVHRRPDDAYLNRLDALRNWRKQLGQSLGVESDVVLPRDVMERLALSNPDGPEDLVNVMADVPWRQRTYGEQILNAIHPRRKNS